MHTTLDRGLSEHPTRREFLRKGMGAFFLFSALTGVNLTVWAQEKKEVTADLPKTFDLVRSKFTPHLSEFFNTNINGEEIYFQLIEVADLKEPSVAKSALYRMHDEKFREKIREESFTLLFRATTEIDLRQTTYRLKHDALGKIELFLVPVGRKDGPWKYYEAVFNRLQQ